MLAANYVNGNATKDCHYKTTIKTLFGYTNTMNVMFAVHILTSNITIIILVIIHRPVFYLIHAFRRLNSVSVFR
jgi:quinol-cytochrome oxidoreductase complex cytochrome b subunit